MPTPPLTALPHSAMRTRRSFLADVGMGFTGLALGAMLHHDGVTRAAEGDNQSSTSGLRLDARLPPARSVIWLFMAGGVSHVESFDPKPALNKYAGKTLADTPLKDVYSSPF